MNAASRTWRQLTLFDTDGAISSPELQPGSLPCNLQAGPPIAPSGPEVARANRTRRRARVKVTKTRVISGPRSSGSSASAALTQSLVSKLKGRFGTDGLIEYKQTWRQKVTPLGIVYWAHTASARRTSASDYIGWPTPTLESKEWSEEALRAHIVGKRGTHGLDLGAAASLAGWATPAARDYRSEEASDEFNAERWAHPRGKPLSALALTTASGLTPASSPAPMGSTAGYRLNRLRLNPFFSLYLMGFPLSWGFVGMVSFRKSKGG